MDAEPATFSKLGLLKRLANELNVKVDYNSLDKNSASALINEFAEKKKDQGLRMAK